MIFFFRNNATGERDTTAQRPILPIFYSSLLFPLSALPLYMPDIYTFQPLLSQSNLFAQVSFAPNRRFTKL